MGTGRVYVPGRGMKHDDLHPAPLLASRSLAAGASACTPCGAGSYYGSTGVRAFVCACTRGDISRFSPRIDRIFPELGREPTRPVLGV